MQISAVSNQGFTSQRALNLDNIVYTDNTTLKKAAAQAALQTSNHDKHRTINKALWYSIPVAAGLAAGILSKGKSSLFTKEITGTAAKLVNGLKSAGKWGLAILAADAVVGGKNLITKNSQTADNFEKKHPFIAFAGLVGAGLLALSYLPKGLSKLYSKINPKVIGKLAEKTGKIADKINANKLFKSVNNMFNKLGKKAPSVVKETGKTVLSYAPDALLFGTLFHSLGHGFKVANRAQVNYDTLKDTQVEVAKDKIQELQTENDYLKTMPLNISKEQLREIMMENDFLKEFSENQENLKLLKNPLSDLPEEVTDKIKTDDSAEEV